MFVPYKLRRHRQYIRLLEVLHPLTSYIELVPVNPADDLIVPWALKHLPLLAQETVKSWNGTKSSEPYQKYLFQWSETALKHFMDLHNFFIYCEAPEGKLGDVILETEFAWTDVAFLNESKEPLFYTITHEGEAFIQTALRDKV